MPIELKINAETVAEFDQLLARFTRSPTQAWGETIRITPEAPQEPQPDPETPEAPLAEKPRQTRQRKPKDEPAEPAAAEEATAPASSPQPGAAGTATPEADPAPETHPMLASHTLDDVMKLGSAKVSALGANTVLAMLNEKFGVKSFKQLKAEDLDEAYLALEALK